MAIATIQPIAKAYHQMEVKCYIMKIAIAAAGALI